MESFFRFMDEVNAGQSLYFPMGLGHWDRALEISPRETARRFELSQKLYDEFAGAFEELVAPPLASERCNLYFVTHTIVDLIERRTKLPGYGMYFQETVNPEFIRHNDRISWLANIIGAHGMSDLAGSLLAEDGWELRSEEKPATFQPEKPSWRDFAKNLAGTAIELTRPAPTAEAAIHVSIAPDLARSVAADGVAISWLKGAKHLLALAYRRACCARVNTKLRQELGFAWGRSLKKHLNKGEALGRRLAEIYPTYAIEGHEFMAKLALSWTERRMKPRSLLVADHSIFVHPWVSHLSRAFRDTGRKVCGFQHGGGFGLVNYLPSQDLAEKPECDYYLSWSHKPFGDTAPPPKVFQIPFQFRNTGAKGNASLSQAKKEAFIISYFPNHLPSTDLKVGSLFCDTFVPETFWETQNLILDELLAFVKSSSQPVRVFIKTKPFSVPHKKYFTFEHPALKHPAFTILEPRTAVSDMLTNSHLCVYDSLQTGYIESWAAGTPAITYFPPHLTPHERLLEFQEFFRLKSVALSAADMAAGLRNAQQGKFETPGFKCDAARFRELWCGSAAPPAKDQVLKILNEVRQV